MTQKGTKAYNEILSFFGDVSGVVPAASVSDDNQRSDQSNDGRESTNTANEARRQSILQRKYVVVEATAADAEDAEDARHERPLAQIRLVPWGFNSSWDGDV